jgi:hypothetical protein
MCTQNAPAAPLGTTCEIVSPFCPSNSFSEIKSPVSVEKEISEKSRQSLLNLVFFCCPCSCRLQFAFAFMAESHNMSRQKILEPLAAVCQGLKNLAEAHRPNRRPTQGNYPAGHTLSGFHSLDRDKEKPAKGRPGQTGTPYPPQNP